MISGQDTHLKVNALVDRIHLIHLVIELAHVQKGRGMVLLTCGGLLHLTVGLHLVLLVDY